MEKAQWGIAAAIICVVAVLVGLASFSVGFGDGRSEGYMVGFDNGYAGGRTIGRDEGYLEGHTTGYDTGYAVGHGEGYSEGHDIGYSGGYENGHLVGYNEGYENGYEEGYAFGHSNYEELQHRYAELGENFADLQDRYGELEENLMPSFPSGTTDDQLFAWVMLRLEMLTSYLTNYNEYVEDGGAWNLIQCWYYQEKIVELGESLQSIKVGATPVYLLGIGKLEEAIEWDTKRIDYGIMYLETWNPVYYDLVLECGGKADAAANEALKLLWGWGT